jgi:transposase
MEIDLKNLPDSPDLLQKIIFNMQDQLASTLEALSLSKSELVSYKEKYARLIEELRLARQQRFAPSSEKHILQPDLFDEAGVELDDELREAIEEKAELKSKTIKQHPVRRSLPKDFPRERVIHDLPESEKICACGAHLIQIGEEISEQLKYIPAQLSVIVHVRPKYACKPCQENVKIAPMPLLLLPKSMATPELVAHTIVTKYADHVPLYRQEAIWQRLDIDLPRSSLCAWILKTAELCEPLVNCLQKEIIQHQYIQADETTIQVLEEVGRDNTAKSYMWVYRGVLLEKPSIIFDYQETRGGYHPQVFLQGFKGYLQTDAYSGYHWVEKYPEICQLGCMAHARRPFADCAKLSKKPGLAAQALNFFKRLYAIEKEAREKSYSALQRYELRQKQAPPILNEFKQWLEDYLTKVPPQQKLGQAIQYTLRHWEQLNNYLKDGRLEIDNNRIENAIRPFAIGRKNWLFSGSPRGAKAGAILYSLIETCKANHVEPYQYFVAMLHRLRLCQTENDYRLLLPQFIQF